VTKMNIEIIHEDTDMDLYNAAITNLNKATSALNHFIQYRNSRFLPSKADDEIKKMLNGIDLSLLSANNMLAQVEKSPASLALTTDVVRQKLRSLSTRLQEQQEFLDRYLKMEIALRETLFYK
ncbi:MAG TPA: hypothetical protein VK498_08500, partial [Ferruginibacter sp.]|nr:hypothetical protein [Ferruginibacter sp.]